MNLRDLLGDEWIRLTLMGVAAVALMAAAIWVIQFALENWLAIGLLGAAAFILLVVFRAWKR